MWEFSLIAILMLSKLLRFDRDTSTTLSASLSPGKSGPAKGGSSRRSSSSINCKYGTQSSLSEDAEFRRGVAPKTKQLDFSASLCESSAMLSVEMLFFLYDFFLHFVSPFDLAQGKSFGHSDFEFVSDFEFRISDLVAGFAAPGALRTVLFS
jgi:hypothetical protein